MEIIKTTAEIDILDARHEEYNMIISVLLLFVNILCFYHLKKVKNMHFYSKMA